MGAAVVINSAHSRRYGHSKQKVYTMDEASFFIAGGVVRDDNERNEIPPGHARRNNPYWQWMGGLLGLPGERYEPVNNDGVSPAIQAIRAHEERRLGPTVGELAGEVVTHAVDAVKEVVKRVKPIERAMTWLADQLALEPGSAVDIEHRAKAAKINPRTLRRAREKLGVKARRRGGGWWWSLPDGGQPK
jgi:hypothetical protein